MFRNYIKVALRNLARHKVFSIINILGLGVGMTAFILIALLLQYEYSFDKFNENFDRIYRVQQLVDYVDYTQEWTQTPYPLADGLRNSFPEFEKTAVIREVWGEYLTSSDDIVFYEHDGIYAEEELLDILTFNFIEGKPQNSLADPGSIVLSSTLADILFPGEPALGKIIKGSVNQSLIVTGVIERFPKNSHIEPEYLVSMNTLERAWTWDYQSQWNNASFRTYVLLNKNADPASLNAKIRNFKDDKLEKNNKYLYLQPLANLHLRETEKQAKSTPLPYYAAIAIFILVLACINFINLTTARSGVREKEIGIRKVVGSGKKALVFQFLGESVIISLLAMPVAFLFTELSLPLFNSFMRTHLEINYITGYDFILFILTVFVSTGLLSGLYPSFYLSSMKPAIILKGSGSGNKTNRGILRRVLVAVQFVISASLILATLFVNKQVDYMKNKDLGFNKKNLLRCYIEGNDSKSNIVELRSAMLKNPMIKDITVAVNTPFHSNWGEELNWEGGNEDEKINARYNRVDYNFIETMEMKILKGRNFSRDFSTDTSACIINETLAAELGWDDPVGKRLKDKKYTVIGVVKDFHPYSVHSKIPPYFMVLHRGNLNHDNDYVIRVEPTSLSQTIASVTNTLKIFFPDKLFDVTVYDDNLDQGTFRVWNGVKNTFGFFSLLAILIAVVGLIGLASFTAKRRTKEIGIRKVLGASVSGLYILISKEFIIILLASLAFACPSAYLVMITAPGYYKYSITPFDYILPVILIILFTILTTLYQVLSIALTNPSDSLRDE